MSTSATILPFPARLRVIDDGTVMGAADKLGTYWDRPLVERGKEIAAPRRLTRGVWPPEIQAEIDAVYRGGDHHE